MVPRTVGLADACARIVSSAAEDARLAVERVKCTKCDNMILPQTATAYGGLCAPCHQRAHPVRFEITPDDEVRFRAIDEIRGRVLAGCSAEEFAVLRCPVC